MKLMTRFYVYRWGSNAANQPMENGPVQGGIVNAIDEADAIRLVGERVTCYNNQGLSAKPADVVDRECAEDDAKVEWTEGLPW